MTPSELRAAVIEALGDEVLPQETVRERLGPPWDRPAGRDELSRLLQVDTSFTQVSGGLAHLPALLEGTRWTIWVDEHDAAEEQFVRMHPHLDVVGWWLMGDDVPLLDADGAVLGTLGTDGWWLDGRDTDVVLGPEGWLDGVGGGWAEFAVAGGAVRLSPLAAPPQPTPAQVQAVQRGFDLATTDDDDEPITRLVPGPEGMRFSGLEEPVREALAVDRDAFRDHPIPPFDALYAAAGFEVHGTFVAAPGIDWDALSRWQTLNRLAVMHGLTAEQAGAAADLVAAYNAVAGGPGTAPVDAAALDDGAAAQAWWIELQRLPGPDPDDLDHLGHLDRFADALATTGTAGIGMAWLRARLREGQGDAAGAADLLEAAVDASCAHGPALLDLAGLRSDRGDAVGALRLLRQAGVETSAADDEYEYEDRGEPELLRDEVEGFATNRPRAMAGRNEPCPCGSGRKYKACHQGREVHRLEDRAGWLYQKAARYLRNKHPDDIEELVDVAVDRDDNRRAFRMLLESPVPPDIVLHEGGVFAEFLAARDQLLPDDEALLGAQWTLVDRSVFEVLSSTASSLHLRDLRHGGDVRVVNVHRGDVIQPGTVLVGRPLPVGDTSRAFSGFMRVPLGHLEALMAALDTDDADVVAMAIGATLAPPRVTNTDGQDMLISSTTWRVPEPAAVGDALLAAGLGAVDESRWSLVRDSANQPDTVIATATLAGDELTVEVNSRERAAEMHELITTAIPGAEVIDTEELPFEMPDPDELAPLGPGAELDDPALRAALIDHVATMERRWLDESIPALGGRTPRAAAADPIGRLELQRLLASFPEPGPDDIGMMSPARLRAALDL